MSLVWFRRWYALAVLLRLPRKRAFLRDMMALDAALYPLWSFRFYITRPCLWLQVRRLVRLKLAGRWEIGA